MECGKTGHKFTEWLDIIGRPQVPQKHQPSKQTGSQLVNLGSVASNKRPSSEMEKVGITPEKKRQQVANKGASETQGTRWDGKLHNKSERFTFRRRGQEHSEPLRPQQEGGGSDQVREWTKSESQLLSRHINLACMPWIVVKKTLPTIAQWTTRRRGKAGPKDTVLRSKTERYRELVKMLIGDGYVMKLEEELTPILTVKIPTYVGGIEMNKEFYKITLEHSFNQKGIVEDLETKVGMQVRLAMLGVVRFNPLGAKTLSAVADARRAKKEKLLAAKQRLQNDLVVIEME